MQLFHPDNALWQGINKVLLILYAGILWFLCSLPVITMGAASSALLEVMMKLVRNQEGYIGPSFFGAFRRSLRTGIAGWLPLLAALLLFSVNTFYYFLAGTAFRFQAVLFFFLLLFSMGAAVWFFGIAAKFEVAAGETLRLALLLAVRNPGWTLFFILLQAAALFVCWFFVYLPLLFGACLIAYVQAAAFNHIFERLLENGTIVPQTQDASDMNEANGGIHS